jgi:hypothetical protein
MRDAGERQQVMLADGAERDGPGQHQLVITLVVGERGQPQRPRVEQLRVGAGHPRRGLPQILAVDGDPQRRKEVGCGLACCVHIDAGAVSRYAQCCARSRHG